MSPTLDRVGAVLGPVAFASGFAYVALVSEMERGHYTWLFPSGLALGLLVVGMLQVPALRRRASGLRWWVGGTVTMGVVLLGLTGSNAEMAGQLLLALAGPALALWFVDQVIERERHATELRRHVELLAAAEAVGRRVVNGPRVAGWRRS